MKKILTLALAWGLGLSSLAFASDTATPAATPTVGAAEGADSAPAKTEKKKKKNKRHKKGAKKEKAEDGSPVVEEKKY